MGTGEEEGGPSNSTRPPGVMGVAGSTGNSVWTDGAGKKKGEGNREGTRPNENKR